MIANLATSWYQWEVFAEETNLTEPYVFHMVNARGTNYEQTQQGFWSTSFYILRDETSSSSTSSSSTSTSSSTLLSSSSTGLPTTTSLSTSTTATIDSTSTSAASTDPAAAATQVSHAGLSTGAIAGIAVAGVIVAILLGVGGFCYGRRKVRGAKPTVPEPTTQTAEPAPAYWSYHAPQEYHHSQEYNPSREYHPPPQEMYGHHPHASQEQKPVYELAPGRN
ncbi:hypothetical protein G7054_g1618 [Neopestalotiopsis clavispora]|jgi:hypothetical protein|nr:hypothetical protein G7054_g1618 [Neopestalotiopsis clavispora]